MWSLCTVPRTFSFPRVSCILGNSPNAEYKIKESLSLFLSLSLDNIKGLGIGISLLWMISSEPKPMDNVNRALSSYDCSLEFVDCDQETPPIRKREKDK